MRKAVAVSAIGVATALMVAACGSEGTSTEITGLAVESTGPGTYSLTWDESTEATVFASTSVADPSETGQKVAQVDGDSAEISGLDPHTRWYFEVRGDDGGGEIASTRQFALDGAHNTRDIGGYTTSDGRTLAWGQVFRADSLSELTSDDIAALGAAEVDTVVDFRGKDEIADGGEDQLPAGTSLVNVPVLDESTQALSTALSSALSTGDSAVIEETLGNGEADRIADEGFVSQLAKPGTMAGYGRTLREIAESDGALIYHCTAGKDRTGMMTALLLGILGVPEETIVDDFVLSNEFNREHNDQTYEFLEGKGVDVDLLRPLMEQSASNIQPVLDAITDEYDGWDEFAHEALDLDSETVQKLRDKLLV